MHRELQDNVQFLDEEETVVFNHYSFGELIKQIMVHYGNVSYTWADDKFRRSFLFDQPTSSDEVSLLSHELEFHWAMLLVHGEMYWLKGIPSDYIDFKQEYLSWHAEICPKFNLKPSFEYI